MSRPGFRGMDRSKSRDERGFKPKGSRPFNKDREDEKRPLKYQRSESGDKREGIKYSKSDYRDKKETAKYSKPDYRGKKETTKYSKPVYKDKSETTKYIRPEFKDKSETGVDIPRLEGRNPIIEAIKAGRTIEKILVAKGSHEGSIRQLISMAKEKGIVINEVERVKLDSLSETGNHQGVIAMVSPYKYVEVEDILKAASEKGEPPFIIILDEINDPFNLGSLLRSANAAGAHGVIIPKRRAVGLTPIVAKASAGAVEYAKVAKVTNISSTIEELKKKGVWIIGADMDGEKAYYEADLTGPIALVVGSEGEGIGKLVKEKCDFLLKLPMRGEISSLNAGVAGGILMYEILRQRMIKG